MNSPRLRRQKSNSGMKPKAKLLSCMYLRKTKLNADPVAVGIVVGTAVGLPCKGFRVPAYKTRKFAKSAYSSFDSGL